MLLPYRIDTVFKHWPVGNWGIIAATITMFLLSLRMSPDAVQSLVLGGTSTAGLLGHVFLHTGTVHLAGNLLFLWVFGNAVCSMMSNFAFVALYLLFGLLAAAAHVAFDGTPAVGASGAINGIVGMTLAMFPTNRVGVFWFLLVRAGTFEMPLWTLALIWFALDAFGAWTGSDGVAYWAHLGGLLSGVTAGLVGLKLQWLTLTEYDNASLVSLLPAGSAKFKRSPLSRKPTWEEPMNLRD
jgi:membrane associated rhomboid family serine protease